MEKGSWGTNKLFSFTVFSHKKFFWGGRDYGFLFFQLKNRSFKGGPCFFSPGAGEPPGKVFS